MTSNTAPARARTGPGPTAASINAQEVAKFEALSAEWWNPRGPFAALHALNVARVAFVRATAVRHFGLPRDALRPLSGLRIIDVGCGGGIFAESLARLGASVLGVDVTGLNVAIAEAHAGLDPAVQRRTQYAPFFALRAALLFIYARAALRVCCHCWGATALGVIDQAHWPLCVPAGRAVSLDFDSAAAHRPVYAGG